MSKPLKYDGDLWVSTGKDRFDKSWKNDQVKWSDLVERLSHPVITRETSDEYLAMDKARQDTIKDVGGFVGGIITGGRRKKEAVGLRQLLTLDLDFATVDFEADLSLMFGNAYVLYSTHKHSLKTPRFRLIMPLSREVHTDEYEALARKLAEALDMKVFDSTTFQPERLMYWPSRSIDSLYYYGMQDGPWLDADAMLGKYRDWRDMSQWPSHPDENKRLDARRKKQGDPLEKTGVIGAFCRVYSISAVIEKYLSAEYAPTGVDDRYTYLHGSTAGGLVTYEDKFAYSHHSTDPASGLLCNAFDLVRLHKFKDLDEHTRPDTPINKHPSFVAMQDFSVADPDVRLLLGTERVSGALADFIADETAASVAGGAEGDGASGSGGGVDGAGVGAVRAGDLDWLRLMDCDRKGNYHNTIENICTVLRHDISLKGKLQLNAFTFREMVTGRLPWHDKFTEPRSLNDTDEASLRRYLETVYKLTATNKIRDAIAITVNENQYHPVRDYLDGLVWDGQARVDELLIRFFGASDDLYTRAVMRKTLIAAVARVYEPGIKFDNILVLVGAQGTGKSTFIDRLGGEWYSDSFGNLKTNAAVEQIIGVWLMEIGELAGLKKAEVEEIKHFISKRSDSFRQAYMRHVVTFPRQSIFIGTTNIDAFMQDITGGRRFWPVRVYFGGEKNVFTDLTAVEVGQVWAEAVNLYRAGEKLHLNAEEETLARAIQREHTEVDDRRDLIKEYLDKLVPENWAEMDVWKRRDFITGSGGFDGVGTVRRMTVTAAEIWCELLGGQPRDMTTNNTKPIHNIMKNIEGWGQYKSKRFIEGFGRQRAYYRTTENVEKNEDFDI